MVPVIMQQFHFEVHKYTNRHRQCCNGGVTVLVGKRKWMGVGRGKVPATIIARTSLRGSTTARSRPIRQDSTSGRQNGAPPPCPAAREALPSFRFPKRICGPAPTTARKMLRVKGCPGRRTCRSAAERN